VFPRAGPDDMEKLEFWTVHTEYVSAVMLNRLMLFRETVAAYCENRTEHTMQSVPQRKHITSPLQRPTG
jgi:hypothetical protein